VRGSTTRRPHGGAGGHLPYGPAVHDRRIQAWSSDHADSVAPATRFILTIVGATGTNFFVVKTSFRLPVR
jgi:hypothetical protein